MCKKPCKECPFRKESAPGYLGTLSHQPEEFLKPMEYHIMPCHMAIDYDDDEGKTDLTKAAINSPCIGALQFMNNSCKFPRGAREPGIYQTHLENAGTNPNVFKWSNDFIQHHKSKQQNGNRKSR